MIKYLVMDIDGTLTDGKIYMGTDGEVMKAFSVKDGYVFRYILEPTNIIPVVITARKSKIVLNRCSELGINEIHQGKLDKVSTLIDIVGEECLGSCAYFGDDILDLNCMIPVKEAGGIIGCPSDAVQEVKAVADYICTSKAGEGALREFSEWLVSPRKSKEEIRVSVSDAVEFIKNLEVTDLKIGKHIVNESFYYLVQSYLTKPAELCQLESHREYIDIQFMLKGYERMDLADTSRLTVNKEYDSENDVIYWNDSDRMLSITLREGDCIVLYPENAHKGALIHENTTEVLKIVGKVKYNR